jgi:3-(3-hydroxy-phenyl)propionate hydroxylase
MASLVTSPNVGVPDDLYALLVDAHRDLTDAQSQDANVRLVLLLANHIGDPQVVAEAIAAARECLADGGR